MKTNIFKRSLSLLLVIALVLSLVPAVFAADETGTDGDAEAITILYTNDVHTYIDNENLRYSNVAAMKNDLAEAGKPVLLVDAGDHIQGTAFGSMDNGKTIIELMNAADYDLATLGNHEFDYGMARCLNLWNESEFPYISANFYSIENEALVLDAYKVFELGDKKVAFVGLTTPESFTKSTPAYFQNENGEYIYDIFGGEDGTGLYEAAQAAIDAVREEADIVIVLGHLGDDPASQPWTSEELIAHTTGVDAFIDGHSHSTVIHREVLNKNGETVVLTQTGSYLASVGVMTIDAEGNITTELCTSYEGKDENVAAIEEAWIDSVNTELGQVIGAATVTFDNYENGKRLVRTYETNTGDFAADALYYLFDNMGLDVDVAVMNGGGVRNKAVTGELSYLSCKSIHTFGNVACLQTVTGQQILDALEFGARFAPDAECGGFLQVSGLTYEIHSYIENTIVTDDKNVWQGSPTGEYRVKNVQIWDKETESWKPLDLTAEYNLAGYNYTLRDLGDGFAMFDGAVNVLDYVMQDYMVLANYVQSFPVDETTGLPTITAENSPYGDVHGEGRIKLVTEKPGTFEDVDENAYYAEAVETVVNAGLMAGTGETTFSPDASMNRAMVVTVLYKMAGQPAVSGNASFTDVTADKYYAQAVAWAAEKGIVSGNADGTFAPNKAVTRAQLVVMLAKYAEVVDGDTSVAAAEADLSKYTDADQVPGYALKQFSWALNSGLISGTSETTLSPKATLNRAMFATILAKYLSK